MKDKYGRDIDYVRISITDRCNLRCIYCMPEEGIPQLSHEEILTYDEIYRICCCMADLGIRKVKLTGGEPMVRKNCAELVRMLKEIPGIEKVTLTTNGVLLSDQIDDMARAGIDAINVSLDTLDPEIFSKITRRQHLDDVLKGLDAALCYPQIVLKINCVPLLDNESNLIEIASLAKKHPLHVRFIEMMPIGYGKQYTFLGEESIVKILEKTYGPMQPIKEHYGNGPSHYYEIEGFQGKIGFISAMTHKFCHQCNRIRMTADGYLKACLQYQVGRDLKRLLRHGCTNDELKHVITQVIWNKPTSHNFKEKTTSVDEIKVMSQIGG